MFNYTMVTGHVEEEVCTILSIADERTLNLLCSIEISDIEYMIYSQVAVSGKAER